MRQEQIQPAEQASTLASQLGEAAGLLAVGMVSVFIFLGLLIIAMGLLSRFVKKFPGNPTDTLISKGNEQGDKPPPNDIIAAITAAVHQYRNNT